MATFGQESDLISRQSRRMDVKSGTLNSSGVNGSHAQGEFPNGGVPKGGNESAAIARVRLACPKQRISIAHSAVVLREISLKRMRNESAVIRARRVCVSVDNSIAHSAVVFCHLDY
eukprot:SAG11_NODE_5437_length_1560_cov_4.399042_1_plen_116_part_00